LTFLPHRLVHALAAAALGLASLAASATATEANSSKDARGGGGAFEFVALGDMPYGPDTMTGPAYRRLIEQINDEKPVFSIHVGDFKDGVTSCTDELFSRQHEHFQRFDGPLVFTPGDNDWTDCSRTGEDPLERLQALRALFYPADPAGRSVLSLGRRPMAVESQSRVMATFERYRENLRWWQGDVLFTTFHTVGPNAAPRRWCSPRRPTCSAASTRACRCACAAASEQASPVPWCPRPWPAACQCCWCTATATTSSRTSPSSTAPVAPSPTCGGWRSSARRGLTR
jgi:hypothetical protein